MILVCVCVCVCFLPIYSRRHVHWMYQPESHKRNVTQDFPSIFLLRCHNGKKCSEKKYLQWNQSQLACASRSHQAPTIRFSIHTAQFRNQEVAIKTCANYLRPFPATTYNYERGVQRLERAGIRRCRPRGGHQNSPFRG